MRAKSRKPKSPRLVLISVDGLMPIHYVPSAASPTPGLLSCLARRGAYAESVAPVYPSTTFTNHASLATGTRSRRHGILSNTVFDPERVGLWENGESQDWFFEARSLRVPALWDAAADAGQSSAVLLWPVSLGANARWLIPEVFPIGPSRARVRWELVREHSTPELVAALESKPGFKPPREHDELDELIREAMIHLLSRPDPPDLSLLHFAAMDHEIHEHGRDSPEAWSALRAIEAHIERILAKIDLSETCVLIFGDHGFMDFSRRIHLNALLAAHGWLQSSDGRITEWRAVAHTNCAQAAVYARDPGSAPELVRFLQEHAGQAYRVLEQDALQPLDAFPEAACAVEALPGFSLGQKLEGSWIQSIGRIRGEHGYHPEYPELQTGFLALGGSISRTGSLGPIELIDIAPTAASLIDLCLPQAEGRILNLTKQTSEHRAGLAA